jgi:hypothetical protein
VDFVHLLSPKVNVVSLEMTRNERALFVKAISIFAHENVTVVPASVLKRCRLIVEKLKCHGFCESYKTVTSLVREFAASLLATRKQTREIFSSVGRIIMTYYSPELIQTMRDALDAVMSKVPMSDATPGLKAHLAEVILQAAARGQTSYDGLVAAASDKIHAIISMLS